MARITLHNMTFYGFHGASGAERETGRRYEVDCDLWFDARRAAHSDKLSDTVNYAEVYSTIENIMNGHRFYLVEALAKRIVAAIGESFSEVERVRVRVRKMHPPIPGNLDHIEVELDSQTVNGDAIEMS